ncbi:MAG: autoinducer binding domain-containing protein [Halioglobus sp.]
MLHWSRMAVSDIQSKEESKIHRAQKDLERLALSFERSPYYYFRTSALEELADEVSTCCEVQELSNLLWQITVETGFQNYALFVVDQSPKRIFRSRICSSIKSSWLERYYAKNYQFIDPVVQEASRGIDFFYFSELDGSAPIVEAFWQDAVNHGIGREGICFAFSPNEDCRIAVSFLTQSAEEKVKSMVQLNGYDLRALAKISAECFVDIESSSNTPAMSLTADELQFLYALYTGQSTRSLLSITEKFGSNKSLQSSISRKLGTTNAFQAVVIASNNGWFKLHKYEVEDVTISFPGLKHATTLDQIQELDVLLDENQDQGS